MALGAQRSTVLSILIGAGFAVGSHRPRPRIGRRLRGDANALSSVLYGVHPNDLLTFAGVSLLLACVAVLASYIPARRAASIDPMQALRAE